LRFRLRDRLVRLGEHAHSGVGGERDLTTAAGTSQKPALGQLGVEVIACQCDLDSTLIDCVTVLRRERFTGGLGLRFTGASDCANLF
jgi:hypothetical protein